MRTQIVNGSSVNGAAATTFHAFLGCSLDGYIAGPGGDLAWLFDYDERLGDTGYNDFFASVDALAMGRATHETMLHSDPEFYTGTPVHVLPAR